MALRVTSPTGKLGALVAGWVLILLAGLGTTLTAGFELGATAIGALTLVLVVLCARSFRADGEPVEPPRPWWKLTGGVRSGLVVAALFAVQAISLASSSLDSDSRGPFLLWSLVYLGVAALFTNSSLRLRAFPAA